MDFIIEREEDGRPLYLESRVPGVVAAWGRRKEAAKRYPEVEARELAEAMAKMPYTAGAKAVAA